MKFAQIKEDCMKRDASCKTCSLFGICNKPVFAWTDENIKLADEYIEAMEVEEALVRR